MVWYNFMGVSMMATYLTTKLNQLSLYYDVINQWPCNSKICQSLVINKMDCFLSVTHCWCWLHSINSTVARTKSVAYVASCHQPVCINESLASAYLKDCVPDCECLLPVRRYWTLTTDLGFVDTMCMQLRISKFCHQLFMLTSIVI